jgi:hypothetical protein
MEYAAKQRQVTGQGRSCFFGGKNNHCFFTPRIQPRLAVGPVDDSLEQEADVAADNIARNHNAVKTHVAAGLEIAGSEGGKAQKKAARDSASAGAEHSSVSGIVQSSGQPLDAGVRRSMEQGFGHSFQNVKVHNSAAAHRSAKRINALAFAYGNNIVFAKGQYDPSSLAGKRLLAHELAHVIQQRSGNGGFILQRKREPPKYYSYTTQDYVEQVKEALTQTNRIAGVGNPAEAYDILNDLTTAQLKEVLAELSTGYELDVLSGSQSPPHANGVRTEMYIRAMRLSLMPESATNSGLVNEIVDHFGILSRDVRADIVKVMRRNATANKLLNQKYAAFYVRATHTELGGLIFGNFDFSFNSCLVKVEVRVKFSFDSSIGAKDRPPYKKRFLDVVNKTWDDRYRLSSSDQACGCRSIPIRIITTETGGSNEHKVVDVHNENDYREKVMSEINLDISTTDTTMAHEFGHVLGLYDEYDGGSLENSMFWHDTRYMSDKAALMNEGTELRERYFLRYLWEVQKVSAADCDYQFTAVK